MGRAGPGRKSRWAANNSYSPYEPTIWIDGDKMYASCTWLVGKSFVDTRQAQRMTWENRLWRALKDDWGVLAQELKLKYLTGKVEVIFENDEQFVMTKMTGNG